MSIHDATAKSAQGGGLTAALGFAGEVILLTVFYIALGAIIFSVTP